MNELSQQSGRPQNAGAKLDEDALLRSALQDSGGLLTNTLREDDRRRRRRRLFVFSLVGGGTVMGSLLLAFAAGLLTLSPPPPAQAEVDKDAWVKRITGLRDHMQTAFGVGPDLTLLDPDQGLEIVRTAWPRVTRVEVKTGLLKTFAFSKGLPAKHPKVLQVLDLGMNDKNPKVREYAAGYVEEYAGKNFKSDPKGYAAWYTANRDKDPNELLKVAAAGAKPDAVQDDAANQTTASGENAPVAPNALNARGWKQFFSGDYEAAEKTFRQILKVNPNHPAAMNGLGFCLLNQGNPSEAQPYFEKLLKKNPDAAGALNGLARSLNDQGKTDEAIKIWEHAYKLDPAPNDIAAGLSQAYVEKREFAKAIPILEELIKANPENKELQSTLETARKGTQSK
jgi:Flp pilus assembly protein TadD